MTSEQASDRGSRMDSRYTHSMASRTVGPWTWGCVNLTRYWPLVYCSMPRLIASIRLERVTSHAG
jgi:hypothetical protein